MNFDTKALSDRIFTEIRIQGRQFWESWTDKEKKLVKDCAEDAAEIAASAIMGKDVKVEKAQVDAQLANLKAVGELKAASVFWEAVAQTIRVVAMALVR